jgi:ribosomal-protein-alanine N-acetyltransferase
MKTSPNPRTLIRRAEASEVAALTRLNDECGHTRHWALSHFEQMFDPNNPSERRCWVAETRDGLAGFCVLLVTVDSWELENIAVHPDVRRQGVGGHLLEHARKEAAAAGASRILLEVRGSNRAARELYARMGFSETGRRKNYYANPEEDAVIYESRLTA